MKTKIYTFLILTVLLLTSCVRPIDPKPTAVPIQPVAETECTAWTVFPMLYFYAACTEGVLK